MDGVLGVGGKIRLDRPEVSQLWPLVDTTVRGGKAITSTHFTVGPVGVLARVLASNILCPVGWLELPPYSQHLLRR